MNFASALLEMKRGNKVTRKGWNGKNQYIEIVTNISYKTLDGKIKNAFHQDFGSSAILFNGTSGQQVGWLASQADILSEDWQIFDKKESEEK